MDQLRTKLKETAQKGGGQSDNASFPFWNAPENTSSTLRFLPDGDTENVFFWAERQVIRLPFTGVVGSPTSTHSNTVYVQVPCVDMFGETCPIIAETRPWWKDPSTVDVARTYWKKKSWLFQGFVVTSPVDEGEDKPVNPIRRFILNKTLFENISASLANPEFEDNPTDYEGGRDFKVMKTRQGDYANYSTSSWSFKTRSLNENERIAIEQHGLYNLSDFRGRKPDANEMEAIKAMFQASLAGEPYDLQAFGEYYKPFEARGRATGTSDVVSFKKVVDDTSSPALPQATVAPSTPAQDAKPPSARDILSRIKARNLEKASQ